MPLKGIAAAITAFVLLTVGFMSFGYNDQGFRTVGQTAMGETFVKFDTGPFWKGFGSSTPYPDVIAYDFLKPAEKKECDAQDGAEVRYQDGGLGYICGIARFRLPNDKDSMLRIHRAYHSPEGVINQLLKPMVKERLNLTAGLVTSEDAYNTKRGVFTEWARDQIQNGKYKTELQKMEAKDETSAEEGKTIFKDFPVIAYGKDGRPIYLENDLRPFAVEISTFNVVDWNFEPKTLEQIAAKRKATMAIITAKADAERARQDALTAEQEGIAKVMSAKYEREVEKTKAVVDATRDKEVAITEALRNKEVAETAAKQKVAVAMQEKLQQEQVKLAMGEYKQAETLRGDGDAAYKRAVMEADGALTQKLKTYENVMTILATSFGKQKLVPDVVMGGAGASDGKVNAASFMDILTAKAAKDLSLDMSLPNKSVGPAGAFR